MTKALYLLKPKMPGDDIHLNYLHLSPEVRKKFNKIKLFLFPAQITSERLLVSITSNGRIGYNTMTLSPNSDSFYHALSMDSQLLK